MKIDLKQNKIKFTFKRKIKYINREIKINTINVHIIII
jgi:hypothetical protein